MKTVLTLCILLFLSINTLFSQTRDTLDIDPDIVDYEHYLARFNPNPNDFLKNNINKYFDRDERKKLIEAKVLSVDAVIDIKSNEIVELYSSDTAKVEAHLISKLMQILAKEITVSPKKLPFGTEDKKFLIRTFYLTTHEY